MKGNGWKWFGITAALLAGWAFFSMYPDLKRYIKIENM